ncbi:MAG: twin-arginine translocase subunit TatC [Betaproteobacteria bacterium]|nr:twin-arginine translocase subunit TatC [Betaproteobacteria bacterium]
MTGKDPYPMPDRPEASSSESDSSVAEEHAFADAACADGQDDTSATQDQGTFEDTLSFQFWGGEHTSCGDFPAGDDTGVPEPPEDAPLPASQGESGELAQRPEDAPAEKTKEEKADRKNTGGKEGKSMSLMGHLGELRSRLVRVLIIIMLGFFACYAVSDTLFEELVKPLTASMPQGSKLIFTSIPEAFFVYMKVGFVASLFLTSPYTFYQIWAFVAPGLYEEERRHIVPLAAFSAFFFLSGAAFCYFVAFPVAFKFFMSFATDTILPMPSLNEYLGFALKLLIAFGLVFEMPLFAYFLARIGILTADHLRRWRRYAILTIFIVAALLAPPEVVSQLLMAAPMLVLYEISIWIMAATQKPPKEQDKEQKQDNAEADDTAEDESKPAQEAP